MSGPGSPAKDSPRSWFLLGILALGYVGVYLCRKNLAVALPLLRADFHATKEEVGRVASAGTLAYAVGKLLLSPVVDRIGGRLGFLSSLAAVAAVGVAGAFVPTLGLVAFAYGMNRLAAAPAWPGMIKQVPAWFSPRNEGIALAALSLSYVFGGIVAVAFAGQVAEASGQSWRMVFAVPAVILFGILILCRFVLVRSGPEETGAAAASGGGFSWRLLGELFRLRGFWIVCALSFTLTLLRETFAAWAVDFLKTEGGAGLTLRMAAFLSTPFDLCGAAGILLIGAGISRLPARWRGALLGCDLLLLAVALAALPRLVGYGLTALVPTVGLIGFLTVGPYSLLAGYFSVELRGPGCAGTVSGLVDTVGYLAGILAGSAFGWLLDHGGYGPGFTLLAALSLVSGLLAFFLRLTPGGDPSPAPSAQPKRRQG